MRQPRMIRTPKLPTSQFGSFLAGFHYASRLNFMQMARVERMVDLKKFFVRNARYDNHQFIKWIKESRNEAR